MSALHRAVQAHYLRAALCIAFWFSLLLGGSGWLAQRWLPVSGWPVAWLAAWALMAWLVAVNACTWQFWRLDKRIARQSSGVRVPEALLLSLSLAGGLPAAVLGVRILRHKSSKRAFQWRLGAVALLWGAALVGAVWWALSGTV